MRCFRHTCRCFSSSRVGAACGDVNLVSQPIEVVAFQSAVDDRRDLLALAVQRAGQSCDARGITAGRIGPEGAEVLDQHVLRLLPPRQGLGRQGLDQPDCSQAASRGKKHARLRQLHCQAVHRHVERPRPHGPAGAGWQAVNIEVQEQTVQSSELADLSGAMEAMKTDVAVTIQEIAGQHWRGGQSVGFGMCTSGRIHRHEGRLANRIFRMQQSDIGFSGEDRRCRARLEIGLVKVFHLEELVLNAPASKREHPNSSA